uniref:Chromosomal replication initiator protein DnaA n=1 Tax=Lygus hesperus TaxID=30085 RepID=A0A0A9ZIQ5_LYGHE
MAMQREQVLYQLRQLYYLKWGQYHQARVVARHVASVHAIETELNEMQAAHGDIFDQLQLQKKLTGMEERVREKKATLAYTQRRVEQLEHTYALLQAKAQEEKRKEQEQR